MSDTRVEPQAWRLRLHLTAIISVGALAMLASLLVAPGASQPEGWKVALAAVLFYFGDTAVLHLRFGRDQHSVTWAETAVVLGMVLLPWSWLGALCPLAVAVAHISSRRPPLKVAFNAMSSGIGVLLAVGAAAVITGQSLDTAPADSLRTWIALAIGSLIFFGWNSATVAGAVSFSQGLQFLSYYRQSFGLNTLTWLGNTSAGVLLVAMAEAEPKMLVVVPFFVSLLFFAYRGYVRAMQERDTWQVLQATSGDLLRVEQVEVARVVMDRLPALLRADFVELLVVDESGVEAEVYRWDATMGLTQEHGDPVALAGAYWPRAQSEREMYEVRTDTAPAPQQEELQARGLAVCLVGPIVTQHDCLGSLRIGYFDAPKSHLRESQVFATFVNHVSAALHNARLFEAVKHERAEMTHLALHDPLTGLPNRTLLQDRLTQAQGRSSRSGRRVAVMFLDLDRFKVINDSLGHESGDQLLIAVAERIQMCVRPGDTATRFGGDEFVVICEDVADEIEALGIASRLTDAIAYPLSIGRDQVFVNVSIGVALARSPEDEAAALIRDADAAMYRAKELGRNRCELFDTDMRDKAVERLELEADLRRGLERGELRLHYQAIVDAIDGRVTGAEALIRWEHPTRGLIAPAAFVPLAEETGLIGRLGGWVIDEACRQLAAWGSEGSSTRPQWLAVNLSPLQLNDPGLAKHISDALARWDVAPASLCLEITENALVGDMEGALGALHRLAGLGVQVALDDFGTGYSALSYLRVLPVDIIKLDKSFIGSLGDGETRDRSIVGGMIDLAHALGLRVVAEGVETLSQLTALQDLGCDLAQGWHFSRAEPADALAQRMRVTTLA